MSATATRTVAPAEMDFGRLTMASSTKPGVTYTVSWAGPTARSCTCPGWAYRGRWRHVDRLNVYLSMLLSGGVA